MLSRGKASGDVHGRVSLRQAGLRCDPQIGLQLAVAFRERRIGLRVRERGKYDAIVALPPVGGCCDLVTASQLQRVNDPQELVEVAAGAGGKVIVSFTFLSGPITKMERTVAVSSAFGWIMS
jgi:hypothetical protein